MDFLSTETRILLNPRWPAAERKVLQELVLKFPLENHFWIASSGTSAEKSNSIKMVALSRTAILASAEAVNQHLQASSRDIWAQCLPDFHVGGVGVEARAYLTGSRVLNGLGFGNSRSHDKWDPQICYQILREKKITLTAMVPTQIFDLIQLRLPAPPDLRALFVGGAALAQELYENAVSLGWPLLPSFGMTECCSQIATAELENWRQKKRDLKILNHVSYKTNFDGFLEIQSPALLTGYARIENGKAIFWDPKINGWFLTEDRAEIQQGFLKPLGRGMDFVKVLGEGVNLFKLQELLDLLISSTPFATEIVLVAVPDLRLGSRICLVGSQKIPKTLLEELVSKFNQGVAPYERIQDQKIISEIPRTSLGKLSRQELVSLLTRS